MNRWKSVSYPYFPLSAILILGVADETNTVLSFIGGISQIIKDVSDRRALRHGDSIGAHEAPTIRIARTRLETLTTFLEQKVKQTQAELVAVRQSLVAAHWVLVETSTASHPPSTAISVSEESNSPPAIRTPTPTLQSTQAFFTGPGHPALTLEDLRPPPLPKVGQSIPTSSAPLTREPAQLTSSSSAASGLRSKAREILMKYKNRSFADEVPQYMSPPRGQAQRSSSPGGRNGPSPRERKGPYDPPRTVRPRLSKTNILARQANGLRDSFRSSVADAEDESGF